MTAGVPVSLVRWGLRSARGGESGVKWQENASDSNSNIRLARALHRPEGTCDDTGIRNPS